MQNQGALFAAPLGRVGVGWDFFKLILTILWKLKPFEVQLLWGRSFHILQVRRPWALPHSCLPTPIFRAIDLNWKCIRIWQTLTRWKPPLSFGILPSLNISYFSCQLIEKFGPFVVVVVGYFLARVLELQSGHLVHQIAGKGAGTIGDHGKPWWVFHKIGRWLESDSSRLRRQWGWGYVVAREGVQGCRSVSRLIPGPFFLSLCSQSPHLKTLPEREPQSPLSWSLFITDSNTLNEVTDSNTKGLVEPLETKFYSVQDSEPGNKYFYDLSISPITGMLHYFLQHSPLPFIILQAF